MSSPLSEDKRLGHRVVPALARPPDREGDLAVVGEGGVGGGGVLAAAGGVEDHPGLRVAGRDRVRQRAGDQLGAQVVGEGEPDDPP